MQNWPFNFYYFSFQSSNFQFCQFRPLTFNFYQSRISLNPNYGLPLTFIIIIFFLILELKKIYKKEKKKKKERTFKDLTWNQKRGITTYCKWMAPTRDPKSFQSLCCYNLVGSTIWWTHLPNSKSNKDAKKKKNKKRVPFLKPSDSSILISGKGQASFRAL